MRNTIAVVGVAALCWIAGCDSPPSTPAAVDAGADFGGWTWDALKPADPEAGAAALSAAWGSWQGKLAYVVLADETATAATRIDAAGPRTRYDVTLKWPDGRTAEVRIETADGKSGTTAHAGRSCDLADGAVFALVPKGQAFELRQFRRDVSGEAAGLSNVTKLIRTDPELVRLFPKGK
jgi:hypothetical protein